MPHSDLEIRLEIARRILNETIISVGRIAHWTGLSKEVVEQLSREVKRPTLYQKE